MNKKIYIILLVYLFPFLSTNAQNNSFEKLSKKYNGLYIFNDQINEVFPEAKIRYINTTIKKALQKKPPNKTNIIIIVRNFLPQYDDLEAIQNFVADGNNVLISTSTFSDSAANYWDFETNLNGFADSTNHLKFTNDFIKNIDSFNSKYLYNITNSFSIKKYSKFRILGTNTDNTPNFISKKYGEGTIYFHLYPDVFVNAFITEKNNQNFHYTESVLSVLPKHTQNLIIKIPKSNSNDSYDGDKENNELSFLNFVKKDSNLRSALLIGLLGFALYIIFASKIKQRTIPIEKPIQNNSLEYAQTMGDLYFNYKNNDDIAAKKVLYWQEFIRNKYQVSTNNMNDDFWDLVTKKSKAPLNLIKQLQVNISHINIGNKINDKLLIQLNNNIDQFYKLA